MAAENVTKVELRCAAFPDYFSSVQSVRTQRADGLGVTLFVRQIDTRHCDHIRVVQLVECDAMMRCC